MTDPALEIMNRALRRLEGIMGRSGGEQTAAREREIREWQATQHYDPPLPTLDQIPTEESIKAAERDRVIRKCIEWGIEIQGRPFSELQYIVDNKLI